MFALRTARSLSRVGRAPLLRRANVKPAALTASVGNFSLTDKTTLRQYASKADMFCFQCEQTENGTGCTTVGMCGKEPQTAALQDLLVQYLKGISKYASLAAELGATDEEINLFTLKGCFSTLTNVNFDPERFTEYLYQAETVFKKAEKIYKDSFAAAGKSGEAYEVDAEFVPHATGRSMDELTAEGEKYGVQTRLEKLGNADLHGLQELIIYGVKGAAAYAEHAEVLGKQSDEIFKKMHQIIGSLTDKNPSAETLLGTALEVGKMNYDIMGLLESGSIDNFGTPEPTQVKTTATAGKCILVSGHDLKDVESILKQTEGKNINVYTHGELLPAHSYPLLKKYPHLVGNWGGAWQLQKFDFTTFPGPIVMTTNCLIEPKGSYKDRLFTRSVVGWPGVKHIKDEDYSEVIQSALNEDGFDETEPEKTVTVGFGKDTILNAAGTVVDMVKKGDLKHFFLIGGCDGSEGERNYFRELALKSPADSVILTLGCGKYRFNKFDLGNVGPIPRVLDLGQCNDSYGAIQVASALANAFETDINSLPLSYAVSWFEQKAVAVLLTLLSLGVKKIHLGPNLPAFVTPNMLDILVEKYDIRPTNVNDVESDLRNMLAGK